MPTYNNYARSSKNTFCTSEGSLVRWYPFFFNTDQAISVSLTFIWQPYVSKHTVITHSLDKALTWDKPIVSRTRNTHGPFLSFPMSKSSDRYAWGPLSSSGTRIVLLTSIPLTKSWKVGPDDNWVLNVSNVALLLCDLLTFSDLEQRQCCVKWNGKSSRGVRNKGLNLFMHSIIDFCMEKRFDDKIQTDVSETKQTFCFAGLSLLVDLVDRGFFRSFHVMLVVKIWYKWITFQPQLVYTRGYTSNLKSVR